MMKLKPYPYLCTINSGGGEDGVSRVSRLLWQVLSRATEHRCRHLNLLPVKRSQATAADKLKFASALLAEHLRGRVDWIMFDHLGPARTQGLIPKSLARPYAVFLHGIEVWSHLDAGRLRILREARVRIANSNYTAERVTAAHPEIGSIEVCHLALPPLNGADFSSPSTKDNNSDANLGAFNSSLDETEAQLLKRINEQAVMIVGRMSSAERYKGHDELIEVWPQVRQSVPAAQLVIVGGGDDVPRLKQKVNQASSGDSIIFAGHVSDDLLQQLYRRTALFCMPSTGEGFGLVYLEAMQHKLPCIAARDNAAAEVILNGETGLLIPQSARAQLAAAIVELLGNTPRRQQMGEAGYERWRNIFTFENFEQRLLNILERAELLPRTSISQRCVA